MGLIPFLSPIRLSNRMSAGDAKIGHPAPAFNCQALVNGEFKNVSLDQFKGKYVVLFFYPLDFTFVCPIQENQLRSYCCFNRFCLLSFGMDKHRPKTRRFGRDENPILADTNHAVSKAYGCLKEDEGIAFRGLYIIDGKGILRQITINDLPVGRSVEETLRLVQAFQFVDEHGEVCPAGWKPGKDTMKADPKGSKEYFSKQ